jgi:hypothetical protein
MGKRFVSGKDMNRLMIEYVVDYVRANPKEFAAR